MMAAICGLSACTNENELGSTPGTDSTPQENIRREVLLTFKNKLTTSQTATKADTPNHPARKYSCFVRRICVCFRFGNRQLHISRAAGLPPKRRGYAAWSQKTGCTANG